MSEFLCLLAFPLANRRSLNILDLLPDSRGTKLSALDLANRMEGKVFKKLLMVACIVHLVLRLKRPLILQLRKDGSRRMSMQCAPQAPPVGTAKSRRVQWKAAILTILVSSRTSCTELVRNNADTRLSHHSTTILRTLGALCAVWPTWTIEG